MRYGLPYQGSKNGIVRWVVEQLPPADVFVDLFAGGCSVTHAAMMTGKYKRFIANDIKGTCKMFLDAVAGKYHNENRWISREDFFRLKDNDLYVSLCWSFGNNEGGYLYGRDIEPWKKALWYARVFKDFSLLRQMGIDGDGSRMYIKRNESECRKKYAAWLKKEINGRLWELERLESLESLERLQRLQRLQSLERLEIYQGDYRDVPIPKNSVIYCDPPYKGTEAAYGKDFDFEAFRTWAKAQAAPVYISEYDMDDDFVVVAAKKKPRLANKGTDGYATEKIFVPKGKGYGRYDLFSI